MAGLLIPILPKRVYDFGSLPIGGSQQVVVAQRIDVAEYVDCVLVVRVHNASTAGTNGVNLDVYGDGYSAEDPGLVFRTSSPLFSSQLIQNFFPSFLMSYGGTVRGEFVTLVLAPTKTTAGGCSVTLSADLVLRSPDDTVV